MRKTINSNVVAVNLTGAIDNTQGSMQGKAQARAEVPNMLLMHQVLPVQ